MNLIYIFLFYSYKRLKWAGEIVQQLRAFVPAEDLGLVLRTYMTF